MNLTEFCNTSNVKLNTVSNYIKRHKDLFKNHIKKVGKTSLIDEDAYQLLLKKYPVKVETQIFNGISNEEHLAALAAKDDTIQKLQALLLEAKNQNTDLLVENADLKNKALLLEEKKQADAAEKEALKIELNSFKKTFFGLYRKEK